MQSLRVTADDNGEVQPMSMAEAPAPARVETAAPPITTATTTTTSMGEAGPKEEEVANSVSAAHRPERYTEGLIKISSLPAAIELARHAEDLGSLASVGTLTALPIELVYDILNLLDFRSISRFSQTSHLARAAVQTLPAFRDMMRHAPSALGALGQTRLVDQFSAAQLHDVLRTRNCSFCGRFGPYLLLLTCQRACYHCMRTDKAASVLSLGTARTVFELSPEAEAALPTLAVIPGKYGRCCDDPYCWNPFCRSAPYGTGTRLVSLEAARQLSQKTKSEDGAETVLPRDVDINDLWGHFGAAMMLFPSLGRDGQLEEGIWCLGCEHAVQAQYTCTQYFSLSPADRQEVLAGVRQARTKDEFEKHLGECEEAQKLLHPELVIAQAEDVSTK